MRKLISIGECIVDILPNDNSLGNFGDDEIVKAGGAPANVCAGVVSLGGKGYIITKLSTDEYSNVLYESMKKAKINLKYLKRDYRYNTAIAKISLDQNGDRSFTFFRNNTADMMLDKDDIKEGVFKNGDVLHFCSVGLVESPSKYAHIRAIEMAKKAGAIISFDVNIRLNLYDIKDSCISTVREFLKYADIIKLSEEELHLLTHNCDTESDKMQDDNCIKTSDARIDEESRIKEIFALSPYAKVIFLTRGKDGSTAYDRDCNCKDVDGIKVGVVDTTGAGDCYIASILFNVIKYGLCKDIKDYENYMKLATISSGIVCERKGALLSMPTMKEVKRRAKELGMTIK